MVMMMMMLFDGDGGVDDEVDNVAVMVIGR